IQNVGDAAAHPRREVATSRTENDGTAPGHVFTAVVANALNNRADAAVADTETFAREAPNIAFAARRAVKGDIADENVVFRYKRRAAGRIDHNSAARKTLAEVIVGVSFDFHGHPARHES